MKIFYRNEIERRFANDKRWLLSAILILTTISAIASAGGGGGGGGGGSDSGGGGGLGFIIYLLLSIPFPWNIIAIAVLILIIYLTRKKVRSFSGLNQIPQFENVAQKQNMIPADFFTRNPAFNEQVFLGKVNTAFMGIQEAWMNKDLSKVRKWISDGVWQRFNTQFIMMNELGQKNTMSDIKISKMYIDNVDRDGNFDIMDVGIHFTMMDNFVTEKFSSLNQEGFLENLEYWTFIRKSGVQEKDMYHSENCPNCGSPLPKNSGEVSKCESCGTITTLGDYDWVLSEITQANDYVNENKKLEKEGTLTGRIREAMKYDKEFSVQMTEDKASNAYMQIMSATVLKKPERMRRFVSNELFDSLSQKISTEPKFVFNRLYLNNVTLMDFYQQQGKDNMVIAFKRTSQKVDISTGKLNLLEGTTYTSSEIMIMSRDTGAGNAKGSLLAHSCPNCGGPIADTLDIKCQYCSAELNSTKTEWIISKLMNANEYNVFANESQVPLVTHAGVSDLDPLFKVRDYAFNNVMMVICADGKINQQELEFCMKFARKLGYDNSKIAGMFDLTKGRALTLRLPENRKQAEKVFAIMQKAAAADGHIAPEEQAILNDVQNRINQMAA
ncbi:MAG: TIM44-like domain-containing protein [Bacteroidetes bacterium]|nr:TIM44-like domain-containing protein [Bacteroidota bacterium]